MQVHRLLNTVFCDRIDTSSPASKIHVLDVIKATHSSNKTRRDYGIKPCIWTEVTVKCFSNQVTQIKTSMVIHVNPGYGT